MNRLTRGRLRLILLVVFLAIAVPSAVLVMHAQTQLQWEAVHQYQQRARQLAKRIESQLQVALRREEARSYADYRFFVVEGDAKRNFLQRSPLAAFPVESAIPGVLGYFQIDNEGHFSSPLVPQDASARAYAFSKEELGARTRLNDEIREILFQNQMQEQPADKKDRERDLITAGAMNDALSRDAELQKESLEKQEQRLSLSALEQKTQSKKTRIDEGLQRAYESIAQQSAPASAPASAKPNALPERAKRKEQTVIAEQEDFAESSVMGRQAEPYQVKTFESELDPFRFSQLASGHFVFFRNVWRNGERLIQGGLIDPSVFLEQWIKQNVADSALSNISTVLVAYQGNVIERYGQPSPEGYWSRSGELQGQVLYQARMAEPFSDLELVWLMQRAPVGVGNALLAWTSGVLALVLTLGFILIYRMGMGQIRLAQMQQDFISAVSHELKTPLTSIRMYGDMLREGWADEEKKRTYYDFICNESERLTRLIANVLQLARLERNQTVVALKHVSVAEMRGQLLPSLRSPVEQAAYCLQLNVKEDCVDLMVSVDMDALTQVMINLVDNAIKFSRQAPSHQVDVGLSCAAGNITLSVRDYGPGIAPSQMKKIFQLFYRSGNELTRETVGTGIGLALVRQLVDAMNGRVDVVNKQPGAEFQVILPVVSSA